MNIANRIRTGTMSVNGGMSIAGDIPFGGYKASGIGREFSIEGALESFTQIKQISEALELVGGRLHPFPCLHRVPADLRHDRLGLGRRRVGSAFGFAEIVPLLAVERAGGFGSLVFRTAFLRGQGLRWRCRHECGKTRHRNSAQ